MDNVAIGVLSLFPSTFTPSFFAQMPIQVAKVGQIVKSVRDIQLTKNDFVQVLSSSSRTVLPKGSEAEVIIVNTDSIELNCKDTYGWGLKIRVAKAVWGNSFE